jgi:tryptophan synthase beta subunit
LHFKLRIELKALEHTSFLAAGTKAALEKEVVTALNTISTKQTLRITLKTPPLLSTASHKMNACLGIA